MLDLSAALQTAIPRLSPRDRVVLDALVARDGRTGSAEGFARSIGFTSRHQLARLLHRAGLPPLEELSAWIYTLGRLLDWEASRLSLCKYALHSGEDPATYYRLVQRACRVHWSEARAVGFDHMLVRFIQRCSRGDPQVEQSVGRQSA